MKRCINKDTELEMRLFYVIAWTAIIANTIGYVSNGLLYGITSATIFTFVCAVIMYIAGAIGIIRHESRLPVFIILASVDLVEFPVLFCIYGAFHLSYMILGIVATALFMGRKWRAVGAGAVILLDCTVIFWKLTGPEEFLFRGREESPVGVVVNFSVAVISIVVMVIVLLIQYEKQQDRLQALTIELQDMAHLDPLTHLYNRRFLTDYIDAKMKNGDSEFAVALLDIDDFKAVNDNYGHVFGDETLQNFARIMKNAIDGEGIATRFGGEEFMLVFDHSVLSQMDIVMNKIADEFDRFGMETKGVHMSFSGGVEIFHHEDRITKLFNAADEKLYHAKHTGKKKVVYEK